MAIVTLSLPTTGRAALIWHSALDGDASAIVGSNGVPTGTPTAAADKNGNPGGAVLFGGQADQDYFTLTPTASSLMAGSISAWVRPDTVDGSEDGVIAVGATGGGTEEYFSYMNRGGDMRWRIDLDDGSSRRDVLSNSAPTAGTWYYLVATFDSNAAGSQQLRMYIDSALQSDVQSISGDNDPYNPTNDWLIGTERPTERFFNGAVDDVRIYDHELSQSEVAALYTAGPLYAVGPPPPPPMLDEVTVRVQATCDNHYQMFLSDSPTVQGDLVGQSGGNVGGDDWTSAETFDFEVPTGQTMYLHVLGVNDDPPQWGGFIADFNILEHPAYVFDETATQRLVTDPVFWDMSLVDWGVSVSDAVSLGTYGVAPWSGNANPDFASDCHWLWNAAAPNGAGQLYLSAAITILVPPVIPEPTSCLLLGGGLLALVRRRRRSK